MFRVSSSSKGSLVQGWRWMAQRIPDGLFSESQTSADFFFFFFWTSDSWTEQTFQTGLPNAFKSSNCGWHSGRYPVGLCRLETLAHQFMEAHDLGPCNLPYDCGPGAATPFWKTRVCWRKIHNGCIFKRRRNILFFTFLFKFWTWMPKEDTMQNKLEFYEGFRFLNKWGSLPTSCSSLQLSSPHGHFQIQMAEKYSKISSAQICFYSRFNNTVVMFG